MDYLQFHARLRPTRPAVTDLALGRRWTYAEFDRLVAGCVTTLRQDGFLKVASGVTTVDEVLRVTEGA